MLPSILMFLQNGASDSGVTAIRTVAGLMSLLVLGAYFLPSIIALVKRKRNTVAIILVNLLLGWTVIGWIVSLVWSVTNDAPAVQLNQNFYAQPQPNRFCSRCGGPLGPGMTCAHCANALGA
jgi:T4 superinfection immunity protein